MDVPITSEKTVDFNVQEGEFVLRGDPTATSVHMEVSVDRFFIFRLGEKDILQKLIKVTHEAGTVKIATDIARSIANWGRAEYPIDFTVVVPANMNLRLRDTSGIAEISDLTGTVTIDDTSGNLTVERLGADLKVQKQSGDVRISDVKGTTQINSRSGQIHFARLGPLEILASEGNLDVSDVAFATIHNGSGNVKVSRVRGPLTLEDASGEVVVEDVSGSVNISDTSGQIRAERTGALTIRDTDGDITVEDAPSLKLEAKESGEVKIKNVSGAVEVPPGIKVRRKS